MPVAPLILSQTQHIAQKLLEIARRAGQPPLPPPLGLPQQASVTPQPKVKVVCISDTHCRNPEVPDGDVLLHAGDMTNKGTFDELQALLDWLKTLPHRHKVVIAGNHDDLLDTVFVAERPQMKLGPYDEMLGRTRADLDWGDIVYLENSSATISVKSGADENGPERTLKIFGSPLTPLIPGDPTWAFQYDPETHDPWAGLIPDDADIVLTHGPPKFHLDLNRGCAHLLREAWRARPPLMMWGHWHAAHGEEMAVYDSAAYWHMRAVTTQSWGSLLMLAVHTLLVRVGFAGLGERVARRGEASRFVNAAVKSGDTTFDIIHFEV
ncbi:metallophosphatase domain-containing protein [Candidatus Bathyarchaeota archaeon]|nr:metallophosphatase domain-containing protein [Candidatus Bathyarchaeota archaeon]